MRRRLLEETRMAQIALEAHRSDPEICRLLLPGAPEGAQSASLMRNTRLLEETRMSQIALEAHRSDPDDVSWRDFERARDVRDAAWLEYTVNAGRTRRRGLRGFLDRLWRG